jgi:putative transposase
VEVLERIGREVGFPTSFASIRAPSLCPQRGVTLDFSRPEKPTDNASSKRSTASSELNSERSLVCEPCRRQEVWRRYYNEERPHGAIGHETADYVA